MKTLILMFSLFLFASTASAATIYVNAAATGANNGTSWADAYTNLQSALIAAQSPGHDDIYIAKGVYRPSAIDSNDVDNLNGGKVTFLIPEDTAIYGGFAGTEANPADRNLSDPLLKTTLDGDILGNDILDRNNGQYDKSKDDNVYHVVTIKDTSATLDGLTVKNGFAVGKDNVRQTRGAGVYYYSLNTMPRTLIFNKITVEGNDARNTAPQVGQGVGGRGAGMYLQRAITAQPNLNVTVSDSAFINNNVDTVGAGLVVINADATITNTRFLNNYAGFCGTAAQIVNGHLIFSGNTIEGNVSKKACAGVWLVVSDAALYSGYTVTNNIFRGNTGFDCGALLLDNRSGVDLPPALVSENLFENNKTLSSVDNLLSCGAICDYSFSATIEKNIFIGNNGYLCGVICLTDAAVAGFPSVVATLNISQNTFLNNASTKGPGAVGVQGGQIAHINDNLFQGNHTDSSGGAIELDSAHSSTSVTDNDFENNVAAKLGNDIYIHNVNPVISGNTFNPGGLNSVVVK